MSTLSEQIEALRTKWQTAEWVWGQGENFPRGPGHCASDLAPILVAAREQEQELAAMKEPMECGHPRFFWVGEQHVCDAEHECYESDTGCYPAHCRLCVQHSADLREIAEALSNLRNELRGLFVRDDLTAGEMVLRTEIGNTNVECIRRRLDAADSILREFREKKAEVGK